MESVPTKSYHYRMVECLGEGLNSCVYRAFKESKELNVRFEVALKILKSENLVALWRNEFERLMKVKSRHCVALLGWEVINSSPVLVLEYVQGVNLNELLRYVRLTAQDLDVIYSQTHRGLTDLAISGVFHGDLNLQNIMIDETGAVKLVDFGIKNGRKDFFITPKYAAPAVLMGEEPNLETDLFSLDAICAEVEAYHSETNSEIDGETDFSSDEIMAVQDLARKVRFARQRRDAERARTQAVVLSRQFRLRDWVWPSRIAICMAAVSFSFLSLGDAQPAKALPPSRLHLRTNQWLKIQIDNKEMGYSPLDVALPAGKVLLHWSNASKHGERVVELKSGQTETLTDAFFDSVNGSK